MTPRKFTKKGYTKLRAEFDDLSQVQRPKVVQGVAIAAAEGDRSENAEYIYGKKRLREIDKRLSYLSKLLKDPIIVTKKMVSSNIVNFGSKVTAIDDEKRKKTWTIVGDGEADYREGTISIAAPVALALLGKHVGDMVEVELNNKVINYSILAVEIGDIE
jgi:transcription elongation factor GreB